MRITHSTFENIWVWRDYRQETYFSPEEHADNQYLTQAQCRLSISRHSCCSLEINAKRLGTNHIFERPAHSCLSLEGSSIHLGQKAISEKYGG